jgi:hypothetical protein
VLPKRIVAEVSPFLITVFPGLGIFKIPASKPKVFLLFGVLVVKSSGVFVAVFIYETELLKKLFAGRIVVPAALVALMVVPLMLKKSPV